MKQRHNEQHSDDEHSESESEEYQEQQEEEETLYETLGVPETATPSEIKKAYYKKAKECHPDLPNGNTELFQKVGKAYEVLSDAKKRQRYDKTGYTDFQSGVNHDDDFDWEEYWRALYRQVSEEDIDAFAKQYRESEEELKDLKKSYLEFKGNMDKILDNIMLSKESDVPRFCIAIDQWIKDGEVEQFKAYVDTCKSKKATKTRKQKLAREQKEAKEVDSELAAAIKNKNNSKELAVTKQAKRFDDLVNQIQSKYTSTSSSKTSKKRSLEASEPSEEEFQKIQQRLMKKSRKN